jgi:hypothetical protein
MATAADEWANGGEIPDTAQILYACVANWDTKQILVEYQSSHASGDLSKVVGETAIPTIGAPTGSPAECVKYPPDFLIYSTSFDAGWAVLHLCTNDYKVGHSIAFQNDINDCFSDGGYQSDKAAPEFKSTLKGKVKEFTKNPPSNKFDAAKNKISEVKMVLIENIEAVVERHGQIDITLNETEALKENSKQFAVRSTEVKKAAQWELWKTRLMWICVVLVIIGILIGIICAQAGC